MTLIIFGIPFLLCLLVSMRAGRAGVQCRAIFKFYAGMMGAALLIEKFWTLLLEDRFEKPPYLFVMLLLVSGALIFMDAKRLAQEPLEIETKKSHLILSAMSVEGLIFALFSALLLFGGVWAKHCWEGGVQRAGQYIRGGGTVIFFHGFIALLLPLAVFVFAVRCFLKRKHLFREQVKAFVNPSPKKLHPALALLILILFFCLVEFLL